MYDYIIVGQGLAGTLVHHFLEKHTSNILVIDGEKHTASFAAAGIINPVTGRNYVKSWMIDDLLPFAKKTYTDLGQKLQIPAFQELNILRTLYNVQEENDWTLRLQDEAYAHYILENADISEIAGKVNGQYSYGEVANGLQIKLKDIIVNYRNYLKKDEKYICRQILNEAIKLNEEGVIIDCFEAKNVIFCEGYQAMRNDLFKNLPFQPAKGNALIIKSKFIKTKNLRDKIFITPLGEDLYWVGSGYQFNIDNELPDEKEIEKLTAQLSQILKVPFEMVDTLSGIRPAVKTRKPLLGSHPMHKNVFLMNGLGTKGSSLGPYFAHHLVEHVMKHTPIMQEVSIEDKFK